MRGASNASAFCSTRKRPAVSDVAASCGYGRATGAGLVSLVTIGNRLRFAVAEAKSADLKAIIGVQAQSGRADFLDSSGGNPEVSWTLSMATSEALFAPRMM
jgi:hypothetical protein